MRNKAKVVWGSVKNRGVQMAAGVGTAVASSVAMADTAAFTAAVTTATGDIGTYGAALVGVAAVGVGFAIGIKYVKKIARAS